MSDNAFKVLVVALLLLILGAVLGNLSANYLTGFEADEFLEFEEDLHFFEEELVQHRYNIYSFEEFNHINGVEIFDTEDIFVFAEAYGYEVFEEEEMIELFFAYECDEDDLGRFICLEESIMFLLEEGLVEHRWEGFVYEDE